MSCGDGIMTRIRKCDNPEPSKAGKGCREIGPARETQSCEGEDRKGREYVIPIKILAFVIFTWLYFSDL